MHRVFEWMGMGWVFYLTWRTSGWLLGKRTEREDRREAARWAKRRNLPRRG